jgi:hypothetical protein
MTNSSMRYRLVPARGGPSWHAESYEEAKQEGEEGYALTGVPVLLCEAPIGGLVRHIETIGGKARRRR